MKTVRFLIIGAGPTGLGAAYRLKQLGISDFLVVDSEANVGGLARSEMDSKGFTWDLGGHVHFSHYTYYDQAVDAIFPSGNWFTHERVSQIFYGDRFIPFPFQNYIHHLPSRKKWMSFIGLAWAQFRKKYRGTPQNFGQWIETNYGPGIAAYFLRPYNRKVWAHPLDQLGTYWVQDRVAQVKLSALAKTIVTGRDLPSWGPNSTFRFPKEGATGALWTAFANDIGMDHIRLKTALQKINARDKSATFGGMTYQYQTLINSSPLNRIVELTDGISAATKQAATRLRYSSVHLVGLGFKGPLPTKLKKVGWIYFPQSDIPFYRATVLSNYTPHCVPDSANNWSLLTESSESLAMPRTGQNIAGDAQKAVLRVGFVRSDEETISCWTKLLPMGYPTPTKDRDALLGQIHPELESLGIFSRGRFGAWKYEASNQDHCFMQGVEAINRVILNEPELTFPHPEEANRGKR